MARRTGALALFWLGMIVLLASGYVWWLSLAAMRVPSAGWP
jgi:hypothetical protein